MCHGKLDAAYLLFDAVMPRAGPQLHTRESIKPRAKSLIKYFHTSTHMIVDRADDRCRIRFRACRILSSRLTNIPDRPMGASSIAAGA